jgi:hypothetical protein
LGKAFENKAKTARTERNAAYSDEGSRKKWLNVKRYLQWLRVSVASKMGLKRFVRNNTTTSSNTLLWSLRYLLEHFSSKSIFSLT